MTTLSTLNTMESQVQGNNNLKQENNPIENSQRTSKKTAILLINLGGPDCLDNVKPFLYNLFSDPDLIKLPLSVIFQKPLAWWIATTREEEAKHNYAMMGGASPILKATQAQGDALLTLLKKEDPNLSVYIGMRAWHPFIDEAVAQMAQDGIEHIIVLPLFPHFSYTTVGSGANELNRVLERARQKNGYTPTIEVVPPFYNNALYLQSVAESIQTSIDEDCWSCPDEEIHVLFSAHSLPLKHIKRTQDPYPKQIAETIHLVMEQYFPHLGWDLAYQSKVGRMPWLGPSTDGALHYFAGLKKDNLLLVPISFVSDHVETLVEIDRLYIPLANELGIQHCHRAPSLNTSPTFIQALAEIVLQQK